MIDPANLTDFDRTYEGLQEFALFTPLVIGTDAGAACATMNRAGQALARCKPGLNHPRHAKSAPAIFEHVAYAAVKQPAARAVGDFAVLLRDAGARWYWLKAKAWYALAESQAFVGGAPRRIDLAACSRDDLVCLPGFGLKTASMFLLHSRRGWEGACLDRHILRRLAELYPSQRVPRITPSGRNEYERVEQLFLRHCRKLRRPPAEVDLEWWNASRRQNRLTKEVALAT